MRYDQIMPAILADEVDGGVIIHESRFTYQLHGLEALLDLGEWWEGDTGLPLPLGAILARRDLGEQRLRQLDAAVRASLERAWQDPSQSKAYIRQHAHELSEQVIEQHITTFVNDFSLDVGAEGERAVVELHRRAVATGVVGPSALALFVS